MITKQIKQLVSYALSTGLIEPEDKIYVTNSLLSLFELSEYEEKEEVETVPPLEEILEKILDFAV